MAGDHFFLGKAGDHLCCTSMKLVLVCQTIKASSQKKKNDQCLCIELALVSVSSPKREPIHVMSLRASPAVAPPPPGRIQIVPWGRAGVILGAGDGFAPSRRPQLAPRRRNWPTLQPNFGE